MKKLLAMLLCLIMVVGLFAACNTTGGGNNNQSGEKEIPIGPDGRQIITIGMPQKTTVTDYETNEYIQWLEKETGYDIQIQMYSSSVGDYKTQLATAIINQSEDLPHILIGFKGMGDGVWRQYGEDGYFIDLTDYMMDKEGKAKEWWDRAAELDPTFVDLILKRAAADDGKIYAFPRVEETVIDTMDYKAFINQKWLTKLGLKNPTSTQELYDVLVAFRDKDPNGNGKKDEVPLVGSSNVVDWIINMFVYWRYETFFNLSEDGKTLTVPATSDDFREALIFARKLMDEGLMHSSIFNMSDSELKSMLCPADNVPIVGCWLGHPTLSLEVGHQSVYDWTAMNYWGCAVRNENQNTYDTYITEDAPDVDACWKVLMTMASEESAIRQRYGAEGVNWVKADEGAKSFLGLDAKIKMISTDPFGTMNNQCINNITATILTGAENEYIQLDENTDPWQAAKLKMLKEVYDNYTIAEENNNPKYVLPVVHLNMEEARLHEDELSNTKSIYKAYRMAFVVGSDGLNPNNDGQWKEYLQQLEANGLQVWKDQIQRMYVDGGYMDTVLNNAN